MLNLFSSSFYMSPSRKEYKHLLLVFHLSDLYMPVGPLGGHFWARFGPRAASFITRLYSLFTGLDE